MFTHHTKNYFLIYVYAYKISSRSVKSLMSYAAVELTDGRDGQSGTNM